MDDLISRQEALDAIDELVSTMSVCVCVEECRGMNWMKHRAIATIEALPTAERVGKWKYETMRHIMTGEMRTVRICSECGGGWFRYDLSDGVEDAEPNYCPNCGARMEGEKDE